MAPDGYRIDTDPNMVDAIKRIFGLVDPQHSNAPKLGLDWRIVVERNGRPAGEIARDRNGVRISFYGDAQAEGTDSTAGISIHAVPTHDGGYFVWEAGGQRRQEPTEEKARVAAHAVTGGDQ